LINLNAHAIKRKIFVHEIFYSHANDSLYGSELSVLISNTSPTSQIIDFSNLSVEVFYKTPTQELRKTTATPSVKFIGTAVLPTSRTTSLTNPVTLDSSTNGAKNLQIIFSISPQNLSGPYLGFKTLGGLKSNDIAAADNINYITLTGFIEASDSDPKRAGYVTAIGSIIKPRDVSGFETTETLDFKVYNGKAF
jgi:hypothetical protein